VLHPLFLQSHTLSVTLDPNTVHLIQENKQSVIIAEELDWQLRQGTSDSASKQLYAQLMNNHIAAVVKLMTNSLCIGFVLIKDSDSSNTLAAEDIMALQKFSIMVMPVITQSMILGSR